jgi:hypothetical protein
MTPATTQTRPARTCKPTIVRKIADVDGISIPATMVISASVMASPSQISGLIAGAVER